MIFITIDVLRSQDARIKILEEEVKASAVKELEAMSACENAVKEVDNNVAMIITYY